MKTLEELNLVDDFLVNSLTSRNDSSVEKIQKPMVSGWTYIWMKRMEKFLILSRTRMTEREISQHFPVEHVFIMQRSMQEICRQAKNMESFEM